jgi:hypothetical protein
MVGFASLYSPYDSAISLGLSRLAPTTARCIMATVPRKGLRPALCALAPFCPEPNNQRRCVIFVSIRLGGALGVGIMKPRRLTTATLCRSVILAGCVVAWPAAMGLAGDGTGTTPMDANTLAPIADANPAETRSAETTPAAAAQVVAADSSIAGSETPQIAATESRAATTSQQTEAPQLAATNDDGASAAAAPATTASIPPATADAKTASEPAITSDQPKATDSPGPRVQTASADPSEMLPAEPSAAQQAATSLQDRAPAAATAAIDSAAVLDECYVVDACVDRYLWALYQRTPKEDSIKLSARRAVTVKKKHRMVTVMKTFTRLVDEDFAWKDQKASDKAGQSMMDYVIGGMDRSFKLKLFHTLLAAEAAGLSPGITSAFRDDYRQSIASGLKAANDRSYHGGSFRGGYGHGMAADVVSVKGATRAERWASTEIFWKWIDAHGKDFGVGRPYLSYDPPHVGPIDGEEWAKHRGGETTRRVASDVKTHKHLAMRDDHRAAKHADRARSARAGAMRSARNTPSRSVKLHG